MEIWVKTYMGTLFNLLRFAENMNQAQHTEYDRIDRAIHEIAAEREQMQKELAPLVGAITTVAQRRQYVGRVVALFERHKERLAELSKDCQRLLIDVGRSRLKASIFSMNGKGRP